MIRCGGGAFARRTLIACIAPLTLAPVTGSAAASSASSLRFTPCPRGLGVDHTTGCARIKVPLDYSHPHGQQISLMVASKAAAGSPSERQGVLFVNPGGPGVSALPLASATWNALPHDLQAAYQVVAIDPRGVGSSTPLSCDLERLYRPPLPDFVPADARAERRQVARAQATARACAKHSHAFLAHLDTADTARDMDAVRAALGEQQINYLGYSYGTYLGEVYGQLFPERLRRMILDSVVDPGSLGYSATFPQDRAFQVRLGDFFAWTARRDHTYQMGASTGAVGSAWRTIRGRLAARPAGGQVGPSELDLATTEALYSTATWPDLAAALSAYRRGRPDPLILVGGHILSGAAGAASLVITCRDTPWPSSWSRWSTDARRIFPAAPLAAWESTWASAPCAFWPVRGGAPVSVTGRGVPPVLILQSIRDPATPMQGAVRVRALYGGQSRLVLDDGGDHGQYLFIGNPCVNGFGNAYLRTGSLPASDARCHAAAVARRNAVISLFDMNRTLGR